mmetsp:Transcript_29518/g.87596  ORF Transcript_29518/g.87596 Transcript_29518/m.87596 type:complete len:290 (-) Transcript_29518:328-1197(-)
MCCARDADLSDPFGRARAGRSFGRAQAGRRRDLSRRLTACRRPGPAGGRPQQAHEPAGRPGRGGVVQQLEVLPEAVEVHRAAARRGVRLGDVVAAQRAQGAGVVEGVKGGVRAWLLAQAGVPDPWMPQGLRGARPDRGVRGQQVRDELLGLPGELLQHIGQHGGRVRCPADRLAREHHVDGDAQGPHVDLVRVARACEDLWRHVDLGAADPMHYLVARPPPVAEAEVDKLHLLPAFALEGHVLRLDVAVHDALLVQVPDGLQHLLDQAPRLLLAEPPLVQDVLQDIPAL